MPTIDTIWKDDEDKPTEAHPHELTFEAKIEPTPENLHLLGGHVFGTRTFGSLYMAMDFDLSDLNTVQLVGARRLVHNLSSYTTKVEGNDDDDVTILDMPLDPEGVPLRRIYEALWASYMLCFEATDARHEGRAPRTDGVAGTAVQTLQRLNVPLPSCDRTYHGAYWEGTSFRFDADTGTLTAELEMGS